MSDCIHPPCFWALLSPEHFRFLYLPDSVGSIVVVETGKTIKELLLHRSLLEFIHPEELDMAKTDLSNFKLCRTLAGSITRCRLKAFKDIRHHQHCDETDMLDCGWNVVDVVMYIAAEDMILTFFHNSEYFRQAGRVAQQCGDKHFELTEAKIMARNLIQQGLSRAPQPKFLPMDPFRLFQIHNAETRQLLVSWPSSAYYNNTQMFHQNPYEQTIEELSKLAREVTHDVLLQRSDLQKADSKNDVLQIENDIACTRHHQSTSIVSILGGLYRLERIVIPYGNIVFGAFHISKVPTLSRYEDNVPPPSPWSYDLSSSNAFPHLPNAQQQQRSSSSTQQYRTASWPLHTTAAAAAAAAPRFGGERKRWQEGFEQDDPLLPIHTTRPYGFRRSLSQSTRAAPEIRICSKCHTSTSPEWRKGPSGNKTLCNACGLRFSRLVAKQKRIESRSSAANNGGGGGGGH